jgi:hypothetical protein
MKEVGLFKMQAVNMHREGRLQLVQDASALVTQQKTLVNRRGMKTALLTVFQLMHTSCGMTEHWCAQHWL